VSFYIYHMEKLSGMVSELINLVRHMKAYPNDTLGEALRNVFDFDIYRPETIDKLSEILIKHGYAASTKIYSLLSQLFIDLRCLILGWMPLVKLRKRSKTLSLNQRTRHWMSQRRGNMMVKNILVGIHMRVV
jgi:hypothetical protein